jgi:hypothetical protein
MSLQCLNQDRGYGRETFTEFFEFELSKKRRRLTGSSGHSKGRGGDNIKMDM